MIPPRVSKFTIAPLLAVCLVMVFAFITLYFPTAMAVAGADQAGMLLGGLTFYTGFENGIEPVVAAEPYNLSGSYLFPEGRVGKGLKVDDDSQVYIPVLPAEKNFPYLEGTLSLWYRPDIQAGESLNDLVGFLFAVYTPGRFYITLRPDGILPVVAYAKQGIFNKHWLNELISYDHFGGPYQRVKWQRDKWYHYVWTWDGEHSATYIDGVKVADGKGYPQGVGADSYFGRDMQIAGMNRTSYLMKGTIDELAIWRRVLSPDEVVLVHAKGSRGQSLAVRHTTDENDAVSLKFDMKGRQVARNLLNNGSFEGGISNYFYAENPHYSPLQFSTGKFTVSDGDSFHGRRSLKIVIPPVGPDTRYEMARNYGTPGTCMIETLALPFERDTSYFVGVSAKSNNRVKLELALVEPGDAHAERGPIGLASVQLGREWKTLRLADVRLPSRTHNASLRLKIQNMKPAETATIYLDAMEVIASAGVEGQSEYIPRNKTTGTLRTAFPGNIIKSGHGPAAISLTLANNTGLSERAHGRVRIVDVFSREVNSTAIDETLPPYRNKLLDINLPELGCGAYRAELILGDNPELIDSLVLSVLPGDLATGGMGVHAFLDDYSLSIARRLGFTWLRLWDDTQITQWHFVQPRPFGPFEWDESDRYMKKISDYGFKVLAVLYHVSEWTPDRITGKSPHWIYQALGNSNYGSRLLSNDRMFRAWIDYVKAVVGRYKEEVKYWEVMNEPYSKLFGKWSPDNYVSLISATSRAVKEVDKNASIVGPVAYAKPRWVEPMLGKDLLDYIDVFSYHGYHLDMHDLEKMRKWASSDGVARDIFDTEDSGNLTTRYFHGIAASDRVGRFGDLLTGVATHAQMVIKGKAIGAKVIFEYWMRPYRPYSEHGSMFAFDGTIRPGVIAYLMAFHMLDGYEFKEMLSLGSYLVAYIFENRNSREVIAAIYDRRPAESKAQSVLNLVGSRELTVYDVFGNSVDSGTEDKRYSLDIGAVPVYLKAAGSIDISQILHRMIDADKI